MTREDHDRFLSLRSDLFTAIRKAVEGDGHCKSYEGAFQISKEYPHCWDHDAGRRDITWAIHLDCYVVGPHRHYDWSGKTFKECLDKCEKNVRSWIAGGYEETES